MAGEVAQRMPVGRIAGGRSGADPAPVEYAVAVDRYLARAPLRAASRRVYRISLTSWAWPLVGKLPPPGRARRGALPPVVPLALLDDERTGPRLAAALAERARHADARTVNRELSALRSAVGWWQDQEWICSDPTARLAEPGNQRCPQDRPGTAEPDRLGQLRPPLSPDEVAALLRSRAALREQALWHLLYDTGAPVEEMLALDAGQVDVEACRARAGRSWPGRLLTWCEPTSALLRWLLAGRQAGPVFLTSRRAPAGTPRADVCPLTGQARLSYRRTAEIFAEHTRPLDPAGRGWTLHQLRQASQRGIRDGR